MLLTQDQEMIRDAVRAFAQEELWPHAARWDKEHHFPRDAHQGLAALGAYAYMRVWDSAASLRAEQTQYSAARLADDGAISLAHFAKKPCTSNCLGVNK